MIAPQILVLSLFLSFVWGWHLVDMADDWRKIRRTGTRRRGEMADTFRALLCVVALWSICVSYVVRTALIVAGLGDAPAGQVGFFTIIGINIPVAIFALVSRRMR